MLALRFHYQRTAGHLATTRLGKTTDKKMSTRRRVSQLVDVSLVFSPFEAIFYGGSSSLPSRRRTCDETAIGACRLAGAPLSAAGARS